MRGVPGVNHDERVWSDEEYRRLIELQRARDNLVETMYREVTQSRIGRTEGVWVVYYHDGHRLPVAIFLNELEARRYADNRTGTESVGFWRFGAEWSEPLIGEEQ